VGEIRGTSPDSAGDGRLRRVSRSRAQLAKLRAIATATQLFFAALLVGGQRCSRGDRSGDIRGRERRSDARMAVAGGEPWWIGWCRGGRVRGEWADQDHRVSFALCTTSLRGSTRGEAGLIALSLIVGAMLALYAALLLIQCDQRRAKAAESHYAAPLDARPDRVAVTDRRVVVSGGW